MNTRYFHIGLVLWIFAVVPPGFAESFPNRPTAGEMDNIVALGTECMLGVNERCLATQYQINPVAYRVAPFTNTAGFYLDQNAMGAMAAKIRSLVQYYYDPVTFQPLTVTGLWARLEIGDHNTNFTCIPAIGTNAATYGDNPWRIYVTNLQERYKVLNAMRYILVSVNTTNGLQSKITEGPDYAHCLADWPSATFVTGWGMGLFPGAGVDTIQSGPWNVMKQRAYLSFVFSGNTNIPVIATILGHVERATFQNGSEFLSFEAPGNEGDYLWLDEFSSPLIPGKHYVDSTLFGDSGAIVPDPGSVPSEWARSWKLQGNVLFDWQFTYCTYLWR